MSGIAIDILLLRSTKSYQLPCTTWSCDWMVPAVHMQSIKLKSFFIHWGHHLVGVAMYSTNYTDSGAVAYCLRVVHTWLKEHNITITSGEDSRRLLHHCYLRLVMLYDIIFINWWVWLNNLHMRHTTLAPSPSKFFHCLWYILSNYP